MRIVIPLSVLVLVLGGCRQRPLAPGISDSTFVRVMAGLRRLPTGTAVDRYTRDHARDSILKAHGVTAPQIESAAVALAADPERAAALWRAIDAANTSRPAK